MEHTRPDPGRSSPLVVEPDRPEGRRIPGVDADMLISLLAIAAPLAGALVLAVVIARDRNR